MRIMCAVLLWTYPQPRLPQRLSGYVSRHGVPAAVGGLYFVLPAQDSPVKQVLILGHKSVIVFRHVLFMTNFINNAPGDK